MEPAFLTGSNVLNILRQASALGIVCLGVTFVMMTGGMDLSVGSVLSLCSVAAVSFMNRYGQAPGSNGTALMAFLAVIVIGFAVGLVNGSIITILKGRLGETFIITYGMEIVVASLALLYTRGQFVPGTFGTGLYEKAGMGFAPIICFLFLALVMHVVLAYTGFGKQISFIGANMDCARMSGLKVGKLRVITYGICGVCAGIASVIVLSACTQPPPCRGRVRAGRDRSGDGGRYQPAGEPAASSTRSWVCSCSASLETPSMFSGWMRMPSFFSEGQSY